MDHAPGQDGEPPAPSPPPAPSRGTVLREWGRIGCLGFGGPPAHLRMLRDLCVDRRRWIEPSEFEDAVEETVVVAATRATPASLAAVAISAMRGRYVTSVPRDTG